MYKEEAFAFSGLANKAIIKAILYSTFTFKRSFIYRPIKLFSVSKPGFKLTANKKKGN